MNTTPLDVLKLIRDYKDKIDTHQKFKKCLKEINEIKYTIKYNYNHKLSYSKRETNEKIVEYDLGCNLVYDNGIIDELYSDCHVRWYSSFKSNIYGSFGKWLIWDNQEIIFSLRNEYEMTITF